MKVPFPSWRLALLAAALLTLGVSMAMLSGCSKKSPLAPVDLAGVTEPGSFNGEFSLSNPKVLRAAEIQGRHTPALMGMHDVVGTATGFDADGNLAVLVLTERPLGPGALPATLEGLPVVEEVTGKIVAMADHKVKQAPPIALGTSGGWRYDLANGYCCGGTLGSLVKKGSDAVRAQQLPRARGRHRHRRQRARRQGGRPGRAARPHRRGLQRRHRRRTSRRCRASRACPARTSTAPSPR